MRTVFNKRNGIGLLVFAFCILLDQISKILTVSHISLGGDIPLLGGAVHLTYRQNTGAAFSMLEDQPMFFLIFNTLLVLALGWLLLSGTVTNDVAYYSLVCVTAGGIGNLIDRVARGFVVDMLDFRFFKIPQISFHPFSVRLADFAVFNIADSFITCGAILFLIIFFVKKGEVLAWSSTSKKKMQDAGSTDFSPKTPD